MEVAVNVQFSLCLVPFILEDMMVYYKRNLILTRGVFPSYLFIE